MTRHEATIERLNIELSEARQRAARASDEWLKRVAYVQIACIAQELTRVGGLNVRRYP